MNKPFFRSNIPRNSTLTILVSSTGNAADFDASGGLRRPDLSEVSWRKAQLLAGVAEPLSMEGVYSGEIDLTFVRTSTVRLQMQVVKPDGSKFVYDESVTQSTGLDRTHILLVVL